ncbi:MAG: DUF58 domain-containing protein [Oscillospiraceae bacterium]|nr:DUF58 domain-containing protein [Oscillospiraceae bacterium]
MRKDRHIGFQSALLVSWGVIIVGFAGSVLAWWMGLSGVGVLLMAVAVVGLISRLWGLYALRGVEVSVRADRETLSAGQSVTLHYEIENKKALPLIWMELCQDVPVRRCLEPDESFQLTELPQPPNEQGEAQKPLVVFMRRFAFVGGCSALAWDTVWTGVRRGVYRPGVMTIRSGDGLGLTQSAGEVPGLAGRTLVVWPKIIPVEVWPFLRHVWTGTTGKAGWSEDPTVMKGERAYQPGDPWKRIDWRTAARTDELMVRQFDTVTPLSVLFILDAATLADKEEAISITASLILALERAGVDCGLALPATGEKPALLIRPEDPSASARACLFALAEFDAESAGEQYDETGIVMTAAQTGQVWLVGEGAASLGCPALAGKLSERGVRLLAAKRERGIDLTKIYTFDELRRKEARA